MTTIRQRVEKGAAWLDRERPGWRDRIDLSNLDLGSGRHCVLGHEFEREAANVWLSGFTYALRIYKHSVNWDVEHGFCPSTSRSGPLTRAWKVVIAIAKEKEKN